MPWHPDFAQLRNPWQRRALWRKLCCEYNGARRQKLRRREAAWVAVFVPLLSQAYAQAVALGTRLHKRDYYLLGAVALQPAGWRIPAVSQKSAQRSAPYNPVALKKAEDLLSLPRVQRAIDATFNDAGLGLDECARIVTSIAKGEEIGSRQVVCGEEMREVPIVANARERLAAVDMRIRLTHGYAPTKSTSIQAHVKNADRFFEKQVFDDVPPVTLDQPPDV